MFRLTIAKPFGFFLGNRKFETKSLYCFINNAFSTLCKRTDTSDKGFKEIFVYLDVPYVDRGLAKSKGAMWNSDEKKWYITDDMANSSDFSTWMVTYLNVPFSEKDLAKSLGAKWDVSKKKWYITNEKDYNLFKEWMLHPSLSIKKVINSSDPHQKVSKPVISTEVQDELIFIFDIETNGLPTKHEQFGKYHLYSDLSKYDSSRIVQMSGLLCRKEDWSIIETKNVIVKADGFPIENDRVHGISYEKSMNEGIAFVNAFETHMLPSLSKANYLIAHNAPFDVNVLKSELHRYNLNDTIEYLESKVKVKCSMSSTTNLVKSVNKWGKPKSPNLKELYLFATGKEIQNQHNALYDVINLHEALQKLNFKIL